MRKLIESVLIPDAADAVQGLSASDITRLSEVAVFAGPNGGGKSRLLRAIAEQFSQKDTKEILEGHIKGYEDVLRSQLGRSDEKTMRQQLDTWRRQLAAMLLFKVSEESTDRQTSTLYFAPRIGDYEDPSNMTFGQTPTFLSQGGKLQNISGNYQHTLFLVQSLVQNYLMSLIPESGFQPEEVEDRHAKFNNFRALTSNLLQMDVSWALGPQVFIGGVPLSRITHYFSQGQKWLLHFITSIYADVRIDDAILLCLDEPELHLHPAALNQIIDTLTTTLDAGQLLIATHSIPLIAHLGYERVWYVADGRVTYAGRQPERVIGGLVGGQDAAAKLFSLLAEPDAAAVARFALESLSPPAVADASPGDPQGGQIIQSVRSKHDDLGRAIRLLDVGAGKGRVLDIAAHSLGSAIQQLLNYHAYDPSPANSDACRAAIARVYGSDSRRYFPTKSAIPEALQGEKFDIALMCNVVHEISPTDWIREFSFVADLLHEGGELIIVEDLQLPHGEHAHNEGFVIGSKEAFRLLFGVTASEAGMLKETSPVNSAMAARLLCVRIPATVLGRIEPSTVAAALKHVQEHAKRRIEEIRAAGVSTYHSGLQHALHLHQFANSALARERLGAK